MSTLRPPRFRRDSGEEDLIRQQALERVNTGERDDIGTQKRRAYPSDLSRRRRTVAVCLETEEDMDRLKQMAEEVSRDMDKTVSPTGLAAMLVMAGLKLLEEKRLHVATESREVERLVVEER